MKNFVVCIMMLIPLLAASQFKKSSGANIKVNLPLTKDTNTITINRASSNSDGYITAANYRKWNDSLSFWKNGVNNTQIVPIYNQNVGLGGVTSPQKSLHSGQSVAIGDTVYSSTNLSLPWILKTGSNMVTTFPHNGTSGFGNNNVVYGVGNFTNLAAGSGNTAMGSLVLSSMTSAYNNVAVGYRSMRFATTAYQNTALGTDALGNLATGIENTAIGHSAGIEATGSTNTFVGARAGGRVTGNGNVYIGYFSGVNAGSTGSFNTVVGTTAGQGAMSGEKNILIGYGTQVTAAGDSNRLNIGNWIFGNRGKISVGTSANPQGQFDVNSTTDGSLPFPRMTEAQRLAIPNLSVGKHVYQTDGIEGVYYYKSTGWTLAY